MGMEIDAGTVAISIEAKADKLASGLKQAQQTVATSTTAMKRDATSVAQVIEQTGGRIAESSNRAGSSQLILQSVIRRTSDQLAAGAPVATIFAEHISGLVEAAELAGGSFGKFGAVLAGPWGLALSAGVSIASLLAQHIYEDADATNVHKAATKELIDAITELNNITGASIHTHQQEVGIQLAAARAEAASTIATRDKTKALLEQAVAQEKVDQIRSTGPGQRGDLGGIALGASSARASGLQAALDQANKAADETGKRLDQAFRGAVSDSIVNRIADGTDKAAAANSRVQRAQTLGS